MRDDSTIRRTTHPPLCASLAVLALLVAGSVEARPFIADDVLEPSPGFVERLVAGAGLEAFTTSGTDQVPPTCGNGVVDSGESCDDGNGRDGDCCSARCELESLDETGTCWRRAGAAVVRLSAHGVVSGRRVSCRARCREGTVGTLIVQGDGTYRVPQGTLRCSDGREIVLPDERGRLRGSGSKKRLRPDNLQELRDATRACNGIRLRRMRTVIESHAVDGTLALSGMSTVTAIDPGNPAIRGRARTRFHAVPMRSGLAATRPAENLAIPLCSDGVRLRCGVR